MKSEPLFYQPTGLEKMRIIGCAAALWAGVGFLFYRSIIAMILLTVLSWPSYRHYIRLRSEKMQAALADQFRDLLYSLSASFSAGRQMREALIEAIDHLRLIYGDKGLITLELLRIEHRMKQSGTSEDELLWEFASRSGSRDIINFVDVCSVCRQTGGDIVRVVTKATQLLISQIEMRREVRKLTAQKRYETTVIALLPLVLLAFLQITSPAYLDVMYQSGAGRILMTLALFIMAAAYLWSTRLCRINW